MLRILRSYEGDYKRERERQRNWVPRDEPGKIKDIIMDPHIQRGISISKECPLCKVIFGGSSRLSLDRKRLQELKQQQQTLGASGTATMPSVMPHDMDNEPSNQQTPENT